ncbi:MAG: hypothetical protein ACTSP9_09775 [Promethearchaeota archaeon]
MLSKQKVSLNNNSRKFFLIHLVVYIIFTLMSNLIFGIGRSPIYPLFMIISWVWLIGLSEHFTFYRIKSRDVSPRAKRGFYYNLATFLGGMPLLILTIFGIPIWGIILIIHYIKYKKANIDSRGKVVKKNHSKTFLLIHFLIYLVNYVLAIPISYNFPSYQIFSLIWLIVLCEHFTAYLMKSRGVYPKIKRSVYYHLTAFLGSIPLLTFIFMSLSPIPIAIWLDLLVIHYVVYHISKNELKERDVGNVPLKNFNGFSEESLKIIALKKVRFRLSLQIHFCLFLVFGVMTLGIDLYYFHYPFSNLFFSLIFVSIWFVFLSLHGTAYLIYAYGVYPKIKRGYYYNLIVFLSSIPFQCTTMLVIIFGPVWGVAVLIHYITYRIISRKSGIKEGIQKTHLQRLVDKEMEKMKSLM